MLVALLVSVCVVFTGAAVPASAYDEGTIVSLANEARTSSGLGGLVHNASLDAVALRWAQQMAANGTLSHNPSVGSEIPGGWTAWGENVAQGYSTGPAVHDGWMNSSGHRANILGGFTDIGVALIAAGGTTWAVEVFAAYPGSGLPAPAPEPPAAQPSAPAPAPAEPAPVATAPADSAAVEESVVQPSTPADSAAAAAPAVPHEDRPQAGDPGADPPSPAGWIALIAALALLLALAVVWWLVLRRRRRPRGIPSDTRPGRTD